MNLSRRDFLNICKTSAIAVGLSALDILRLEGLFANRATPTVLWLQGAGCTGCSVSFLNYTALAKPASAPDILIDNVNLAYHPNVMDVAGSSAVGVIDDAYAKGNYILAIEGGVPTAFSGTACLAWTKNGKDVTFQEAVVALAAKASAVICVGTCAAWGGVSAASPNPAAVKGVKAVTGKNTLNIAGCPPHPDWIVWGIAKTLLGQVGTLDTYGRPTALFNSTVHHRCPREDRGEASTYGQDFRCLEKLGCCGPITRAACPGTRCEQRHQPPCALAPAEASSASASAAATARAASVARGERLRSDPLPLPVQLVGAEAHLVRPAELLLREVDLERETSCLPSQAKAFRNCSFSSPFLSQFASSDDVK